MAGVRISVVADVHGNYEALARIAERSDRLIVLGDLLDYVDYHDPARGILGAVFGEDSARHFTRLRAAGDFPELHRFNSGLWSTMSDPVGVLSEVVQERYRRVLEAVGPDALLILGNVDVPDEWDRVAGDVLPYRDAEVVELDGVRFGFVAGGASRRPRPVSMNGHAWRPFLRDRDDYRAAVDALGPVDVLCTHIPPDVPALRYDVVPARLEMAGPGLIEYIDTHRPVLALFGHVHQPLATRTRRGYTECLNAGHFQRAERALEVDLDAVRRGIDDAAFAARAGGR